MASHRLNAPTAARLAASLLAACCLLPSCRQQDEGERCDILSRDADCADGLECVAANLLLRGEDDRCCPPDGRPSSELACQRRVTIVGGGSGGTGGSSPSTTGGASAAVAGAAGDGGMAGQPATALCSYPSDCPLGQTCGPLGRCQAECRETRDCPPGFTCGAAGMCLPPSGGAGSGGAGAQAAAAAGMGG